MMASAGALYIAHTEDMATWQASNMRRKAALVGFEGLL